MLGIDRCLVYTGKFTNISFIGILFNVRFKHDSVFFRVGFRHVSQVLIKIFELVFELMRTSVHDCLNWFLDLLLGMQLVPITT